MDTHTHTWEEHLKTILSAVFSHTIHYYRKLLDGRSPELLLSKGNHSTNIYSSPDLFWPWKLSVLLVAATFTIFDSICAVQSGDICAIYAWLVPLFTEWFAHIVAKRRTAVFSIAEWCSVVYPHNIFLQEVCRKFCRLALWVRYGGAQVSP